MKNDICCNAKGQGHICILENWHDGPHQDKKGFKFWNDEWPNNLGNGPSGYPMNNPDFDAAVEKMIEERKADAEQAKDFLRKLSNALRRGDD